MFGFSEPTIPPFFFFFGLMAFEIISKEKARMYYELGDHLLVPPSHFAANIQHRNHLAQVTKQVSGKICTRVQVSWALGTWASVAVVHRASCSPQHVGSSWTRDRTCVPCIGRQILNHWTTREVPRSVNFWSSRTTWEACSKCSVSVIYCCVTHCPRSQWLKTTASSLLRNLQWGQDSAVMACLWTFKVTHAPSLALYARWQKTLPGSRAVGPGSSLRQVLSVCLGFLTAWWPGFQSECPKRTRRNYVAFLSSLRSLSCAVLLIKGVNKPHLVSMDHKLNLLMGK